MTASVNAGHINERANEIVLEAVRRSIREKGEVGVQVAAYLDGKLVIDVWDGLADPATGKAVDGETLFNVFSVTKAITAVAVHIQAERGLIDYESPVAKYWPEFGAKGKTSGTVFDALTHRIGVPFMPENVTPEKMCDWDWMTSQLANMEPLDKEPRSAYHAITQGWILGELVRRTDTKKRDFKTYIRQEIAEPLGISDLWVGIPDEVESRVATIIDYTAPPSYRKQGTPGFRVMPTIVGTRSEVYGRADVRRACIAAAGGIFNARSGARFFAMLANGGELGGVRLLSEKSMSIIGQPRWNPDEVDPIMMHVLQVGLGGLRVNDRPERRMSIAAVGTNPRTIYHPGAGGSIAWADPETRMSAAIFHNRMFNTTVSAEDDPFAPVGDAIRLALGIER